jgi:hypothetical protein
MGNDITAVGADAVDVSTRGILDGLTNGSPIRGGLGGMTSFAQKPNFQRIRNKTKELGLHRHGIWGWRPAENAFSTGFPGDQSAFLGGMADSLRIAGPFSFYFPGGVMVTSLVRRRNRPWSATIEIHDCFSNRQRKQNKKQSGRKVTLNTLNPNPNPISIKASVYSIGAFSVYTLDARFSVHSNDS